MSDPPSLLDRFRSFGVNRDTLNREAVRLKLHCWIDANPHVREAFIRGNPALTELAARVAHLERTSPGLNLGGR